MLAYISIISLGGSKSVTTNICEIKYEKTTIPCRMSNPNDPAKRGCERTRIEQDMLDFRAAARQACQLIPRIDGIDRDFLFGNDVASWFAPRVHPLPLAFGKRTGELGSGPSIY